MFKGSQYLKVLSKKTYFSLKFVHFRTFSVLKILQAQLEQWDATRRCDQKWKRVQVRALSYTVENLLCELLFIIISLEIDSFDRPLTQKN